MKSNWAPRIGVAWDMTGEGRSKLFASWGRYYTTIPLDMNVRGIARGTATAERAWASATMHGLVERIMPAGDPTTIHVLPNLKAVSDDMIDVYVPIQEAHDEKTFDGV